MRTMTLRSIWTGGNSAYLHPQPPPTPRHHPYPLKTSIFESFLFSSFAFLFFFSFPPSSPALFSISLCLSLLAVFATGLCTGILNTITVHSWMERKGPRGSLRNRKWSGGLDWGGNGKSLIQLAEPGQQAPGDSYCGISGIKQCGSNHKRDSRPHQ